MQILIGAHILAGVAAVVRGAAAMLSRKTTGRHPRHGRRYLLTLTVVFATGTALAGTDWRHLWHLPAVGAVAVILATAGYIARRPRRRGWLPLHIVGMSGSYVAMLTAFYVDNGPRLPLWNLLLPTSFWILRTIVATPMRLPPRTRRPRRLETVTP